MQKSSSSSTQLVINENYAGQRIDNFLIAHFSRLPRSRIYQMLRRGEVRINSGRIRHYHKLAVGEVLRLPPVYMDELPTIIPPDDIQSIVNKAILYEDEHLLILNKPADMVVHSGTHQVYGVIEALRYNQNNHDMNLVHRLDYATSGCLLVAKNMKSLRVLNELLREQQISKQYIALLHGQIEDKSLTVELKLCSNQLKSGEHRVVVDQQGKQAITIFSRKTCYHQATLMEIKLITGRKHQIRVHSAAIGHSVVGDQKYGDKNSNQFFMKYGHKRLFLHAKSLSFKSPFDDNIINIEAPADQIWTNCLSQLTQIK